MSSKFKLLCFTKNKILGRNAARKKGAESRKICYERLRLNFGVLCRILFDKYLRLV